MSFSRRLRNLNPYDLHKTLINEYLLTTKNKSILKRDTSLDKRDIDVIRENHQFLWSDDTESPSTWEKKLAKRYYDKLYKEYCVGDLSRYKENKFGLRWRTEQEVISGKGQFTCGSKTCTETEYLKSWEVNFGYMEHGTKKNALVKIRLCPNCSKKLNFHHKKKEIKHLKHAHLRPKDKTTTSKMDKIDNTIKPIDSEKSNEDNIDTATVGASLDVWKQTSEKEDEQKSREEEFDEYLNDLFL
ncbi:hypothetical protein RUM43_006852 [Polyplax serrata]|uniref:FRA10AC1 n=1 Tax=Polyplax serrata TaxID=468196 RepID=A0AAN8P7V8_POLSC